MIYLQLFCNFFLTGLFSIGGGLATLPFLYELSDRTGWFTYEQLADMLAVSESTPGAIGINMATYIGYMVAGIPGDIVATLGLITPGIIIILIVARILEKFKENKYVKWAFYGLRAASIALIASAGLAVLRLAMLKAGWTAGISIVKYLDFKAILLAAVVFIAMRKFDKLHPIVFICFSAIIGVSFSFAGA